MLKQFLIISCLILPITACEKIGSYVADKIDAALPEESNLQRHKAEKIYTALQQPNQTDLLSLVEPDIQDALRKDLTLFEQMKLMIPADEQTSEVDVIRTLATNNLTEGKTTTLVYQFSYPQYDVYMSIVFDGHDGGDKVRGLWVERANKKLTDTAELDDALVNEPTSDDVTLAGHVEAASTVSVNTYS